ncbi:MAG: phosphoadenylyl-sulfate reductase, partial [Proteobacteria bacterium]|nr:phosphoadenylyl-sulfate reductase [Pseudomonadota bacterium]
PDADMLARTDPGGDLWQKNPSRCCWLRKVEPLDRTVKELGIRALITGRKRYQTAERAQMHSIELDDRNIFRINPIADWDKARQKQEIEKRGLPPHPLVAQGYPSIGCLPCTQPVAEGQDERAGRWAHTIGLENEQKTECGIHLPATDMNWSV